MKNTRVAVIGAGPSGLAALRSFQSAAKKGEEVPEIVCFEKQSNWGGMWNYTWRTGLDEHGEAVHSSMYRYLWSNGPKECLEFADYTFEEHFGQAIASYPPREVLWDYIKGRVEKAGVRDQIRFCNPVRHVSFDDKTQKFTVKAEDLEKKLIYEEVFDYVICGSGHFSTPNVPYFEGIETFNGRVMHAHDFRDAVEFKGKDLLLIGTSYSAEDIGSQLYKYGAKSITCSHRTKPMGFAFPDNFSEVPLLTKVNHNTVTFKDGTSKEVDAIIMCTGYQHHFPFLPDELRLKTDNRLWPLGLYKGIVWKGNNKFLYLGMQDQFYTFNMFDAQAWYARDIILGKIKLPSQAEQDADAQAWRDREEKNETDKDMIYFQGDYVKSLIEATDYPTFDIEGVNQTFLKWEHQKHDDIMGYRNNSYKSLMTGNQQPQHHTPWLEALDDSKASYLRA